MTIVYLKYVTDFVETDKIQGNCLNIVLFHDYAWRTLVQVTELGCGGVVVGCTFDHRIVDAYSANMFMVAWADTARSVPLDVALSFLRSLLHRRRPASSTAMIDHLYVPISSLPPPPTDVDQAIGRIYYVTADDVACLRSRASAVLPSSRLSVPSCGSSWPSHAPMTAARSGARWSWWSTAGHGWRRTAS